MRAGIGIAVARLDIEMPTPGEQLIGVEIMAPRNLRDRGPAHQALVDDPPLLRNAPGPPFAPCAHAINNIAQGHRVSVRLS